MGIAVVTGSNRGIGLALVEALRMRGIETVAVCRTSSDKLDAIAKAPGATVRVLTGIDVGEASAGDKLRQALGNAKIDLLIHNAGVLAGNGLGNATEEDLVRCFRVNSVAPVLITKALQNSLGEGSKIGIVTSRMGSIDDNGSGGYYAYRMSKAAVNIAGKSLSVDLRARGIAVVLLHPGFVKTEMNHGGGAIEPTTSAEGMLDVLAKLDLTKSGTFVNYAGEQIPW